jgi:hypothetical protein
MVRDVAKAKARPIRSGVRYRDRADPHGPARGPEGWQDKNQSHVENILSQPGEMSLRKCRTGRRNAAGP